MKTKVVIILMLLSFLAAGIYGISRRSTYTDVTDCDNPRDNFFVASFQDTYITFIEDLESIENSMMENSTNVVRVEVLGKSEFVFKTSKQKVLVKEVMTGDNALVGEEIELVAEGGIIFEDDFSVNMGFCNEMKVGEEYLVYITDRVNTIDESENVYLIPSTIVYPVFAYDIRESEPTGTAMYVSYSKVKDYEYFAQSQEGLAALLQLRQYVMEKWGQ